MSGNNVSGALPPEMGRLKQLRHVDFRRNSLTGGIPRTLGKCTELITLNLASNLLQGMVPYELEGLKHLQVGASEAHPPTHPPSHPATSQPSPLILLLCFGCTCPAHLPFYHYT
jgi:hypothetical protein